MQYCIVCQNLIYFISIEIDLGNNPNIYQIIHAKIALLIAILDGQDTRYGK